MLAFLAISAGAKDNQLIQDKLWPKLAFLPTDIEVADKIGTALLLLVDFGIARAGLRAIYESPTLTVDEKIDQIKSFG